MPNHAAPLPRSASKALERWLRQQAAHVRAPLALSIASGALGGVLLIVQAWLLARAVDAVVIRGAGLDAIWPFLWALLGIFVLRAAATAGSDVIAFEAGARVVTQTRAILLAQIATLGPAWTRRQSTGEVANTVVDAAETIGRYYVSYLPQMALVVFVPFAILVFIVPTDWVSGVIMIVSAPLIPILMVLLGKGAEALNQSQWRKLARLNGRLFDAIEGLTTLKLFNASRSEVDRLATMSDDYRRSTMAVLRVAFLSSLALEFFATLSIAMVAVYIGFRLYYREMSFLPGFAVLLLAPEFYRLLRSMGAQYHLRMEAIGAADAIVALLKTPAPPAPGSGSVATSGASRLVRFEQVGFDYGDGPVLEAIDFELGRGRCVALVGPSGAGKSTIAQLLLGLLTPTRGRVIVDGIDLADVAPAAWRRQVAWLPQRPTLFHGSVLDNIRLGQPDADPAAVRRAVDRAGATELIANLPQGYATMLGDRGQGLSGGEAQRIGLARVFLKDAAIVVLDEPAAALDADAAAWVTRSVADFSTRSAVLVIAHRLETVRHADEVLVLDRGRIVERGHHNELQHERGVYDGLIHA